MRRYKYDNTRYIYTGKHIVCSTIGLNIEKRRKYMFGLTNAEKVVVISAFISISGVILTVFMNSRQSNKQIESEKNINQKNIDANIKAKARIEWIQNVRKASAELISVYYEILRVEDKGVLLNKIIESKEKTELLILYFGPDKQKEEDREPLNKNSNEGKNDEIVTFLSGLNEKFNEYYKIVLEDKKEKLNKGLAEVKKELDIFTNQFIKCDCEGNEIYITKDDDDIEYEHDLINDLSLAKNEVYKYDLYINELQNQLLYFRNIIRIYLKIEWNKAKNGQ